MRVLLVEDQPDLSKYTAKALVCAGFTVDAVVNLADAEDAASLAIYDVFLLDRKLPDGDSVDWLKQKRRAGVSTPAIVMTASAISSQDRIGGLYAGADDYLIKPVTLDEVVARVRAMLRRASGKLERILNVGNVAFDLQSREVLVGGNRVMLNRREVSLLEYLIRRCGHVISKESIEERLYNYDDAVSSNAIQVLVHRLRHSLITFGATVSIHTVRGLGYMLTDDDRASKSH
jgi:DNA-binding response OmpR family regulator